MLLTDKKIEDIAREITEACSIPEDKASFGDESPFQEKAIRVAKGLYRILEGGSPSKGLVVSLRGGWGVGKTTFMASVLEELSGYFEKAGDGSGRPDGRKPITADNLDGIECDRILYFNPWIFSSREYMVEQFFVELGKKFSHGEAVLKAADWGMVRAERQCPGMVSGKGGEDLAKGISMMLASPRTFRKACAGYEGDELLSSVPHSGGGEWRSGGWRLSSPASRLIFRILFEERPRLSKKLLDRGDYSLAQKVATIGLRCSAQTQPSAAMEYFVYVMALCKDALLIDRLIGGEDRTSLIAELHAVEKIYERAYFMVIRRERESFKNTILLRVSALCALFEADLPEFAVSEEADPEVKERRIAQALQVLMEAGVLQGEPKRSGGLEG